MYNNTSINTLTKTLSMNSTNSVNSVINFDDELTDDEASKIIEAFKTLYKFYSSGDCRQKD